VLRLHQATAGEVFFEGENIFKYNKRQMKELKKSMQIIFQDPFSSLNPRMTVGQLIANPMLIQKKVKARDKGGLQKRIAEMMDIVGLAQRFQNSYPHELDGGRRQRIGIARALSLQPKFIVCDEPVSALDVSIRAQILNLMQDLQKDFGLTYMFITHDLSVVKHLCDNIVVMYLGNIVEQCQTKEIFKQPLHPYTQALLSAIPVPDPDFLMERIILKGELSSPINPKPGCRFAVRCNYAKPECTGTDVQLKELTPGHSVACIRSKELNNL
jgi:peptide/nickel transport system ATP-binding protein